MANKIIPAVDRFMAKVEPEPNTGCWLWTAFCHPETGYGVFKVRKNICNQAHRFAYELFVGPIPDGMICCHKCDNPPCVNPDHIFLGDKQANTSDMVRKGRYPKSQKLNLPTGVIRVSGRRTLAYAARVGFKMKMLYFGVYATPEEAGRVAEFHRARLHGLRGPADLR